MTLDWDEQGELLNLIASHRLLATAIAEHRARHRLAETDEARDLANRLLWARIEGGIHGRHVADHWTEVAS